MIPYSFLLLIYGLAAASVFIYALLNLYHVIRYGRVDTATYFMTGLFIAGFIFILFVSYAFIGRIDWTQQIDTTGAFSINTGISNR